MNVLGTLRKTVKLLGRASREAPRARIDYTAGAYDVQEVMRNIRDLQHATAHLVACSQRGGLPADDPAILGARAALHATGWPA